MTWVLLNASFTDDIVIASLDDGCFVAFTKSIFVTANHPIPGTISTIEARLLTTPRERQELVRLGAWLPLENGDGYRLRDQNNRGEKLWRIDYGTFLRQQYDRLRRWLTPQVFERDGPICAYCGAIENLTIDHVVPLVVGGSNELDNLQVLCRSCNSRKGGRV